MQHCNDTKYFTTPSIDAFVASKPCPCRPVKFHSLFTKGTLLLKQSRLNLNLPRSKFARFKSTEAKCVLENRDTTVAPTSAVQTIESTRRAHPGVAVNLSNVPRHSTPGLSSVGGRNRKAKTRVPGENFAVAYFLTLS